MDSSVTAVGIAPGAITDAVALSYLKVRTFLVIVLQTLSGFPGDRLSSVLVNLAAKNIFDFH